MKSWSDVRTGDDALAYIVLAMKDAEIGPIQFTDETGRVWVQIKGLRVHSTICSIWAATDDRSTEKWAFAADSDDRAVKDRSFHVKAATFAELLTGIRDMYDGVFERNKAKV